MQCPVDGLIHPLVEISVGLCATPGLSESPGGAGGAGAAGDLGVAAGALQPAVRAARREFFLCVENRGVVGVFFGGFGWKIGGHRP